MLSLTNDMMRQIIMDHYSNPNNKHAPASDNYQSIHLHSDNCIDDFNLYILLDKKLIKDACFDGVGCAISTASTDIMCDLLVGKDIEAANEIIKNYNNMIHEEQFNDELLDEAVAFINTSKQAARIRCATIGWNGASEIINK